MGWFGCCGTSEGWPSTVFMDQNMEIYYKSNKSVFKVVGNLFSTVIDGKIIEVDCETPKSSLEGN